NELTLLLVDQVENSSTSATFWEKALSVLRQNLKVDCLVVLQSVPPEWERIGHAGEVSKNIPTELAGEALDRFTITRSGSWSAICLDEKHVILLNGSVN